VPRPSTGSLRMISCFSSAISMSMDSVTLDGSELPSIRYRQLDGVHSIGSNGELMMHEPGQGLPELEAGPRSLVGPGRMSHDSLGCTRITGYSQALQGKITKQETLVCTPTGQNSRIKKAMSAVPSSQGARPQLD
jgi:hypothetical protein